MTHIYQQIVARLQVADGIPFTFITLVFSTSDDTGWLE